MLTIKDMIEEWIEMRVTLRRQLEALKSGQMGRGPANDLTITRLAACVGELNALLKEYARAR